jgi:hypothetical protein
LFIRIWIKIPLLEKKLLYIIGGIAISTIAILGIVSENLEPISRTTESNIIEKNEIADSEAVSSKDKNLIVSEILEKCGRDDECAYLQIQSISKTVPQDVVIFIANQIPLEWEKDNESCHKVAHHMAEFLLGYFNGNLSEAISHVGNACGNALYHGVVENYFSLKMLLDDVEIEELDVISPCMNIGSSIDSNLHQQCVHGLGHSLATIYNFDVLKAVKRCDEFEDPIDQDRCSDGLFMENNNENFNNDGGSFDEGDMFYPCNMVDEKYKFRCYFYQGYYILRLNDYSYKQSFEDCEKISDEEKFTVRCIHAISQEMASQYFYNDHEKIVEMCEELNPRYQWECIRVSSNALTIYIDPQMGNDLCHLIQEDLLEKCLANWEEVVRQHSTV